MQIIRKYVCTPLIVLSSVQHHRPLNEATSTKQSGSEINEGYFIILIFGQHSGHFYRKEIASTDLFNVPHTPTTRSFSFKFSFFFWCLLIANTATEDWRTYMNRLCRMWLEKEMEFVIWIWIFGKGCEICQQLKKGKWKFTCCRFFGKL